MTLTAEALTGTTAVTELPAFLLQQYDPTCTEFFDIYAKSEFGLYQSHQPLRYEAAFGCYGRAQMAKDLGVDLYPLGHMRATDRAFIEQESREPFSSPEEFRLGRLTTLVHDIGECMHPWLLEHCGAVVGDLPQGTKTPELRATERRVWNTLMDIHYDGLVSDADRERMEKIVFHEEHTGRHGLHSRIESSHDTNSLRVGLRAGRLSLKLIEQNDTENVRFRTVAQIAPVVTENIMDRMEKHARSFVLPGQLLVRAQPLLRRIQTEL
jgi:hypothetical protein